ncbi:hypothetical protein RFI_27282, partial [Reticulomyxa filosa]
TFPFRRTVFVYGLPPSAQHNDVKAMLSPFGMVTKVEMDKGPDTLDREIMERLMKKDRVCKLFSTEDTQSEMKFCDSKLPLLLTPGHTNFLFSFFSKQIKKKIGLNWNQEGQPRFHVEKDQSEKELQEHESKSRSPKKNVCNLSIGPPPHYRSELQTALCVFASQRQASKCVYVRSRLSSPDGSFATHYHHYSKLKKDIAQQKNDLSNGNPITTVDLDSENFFGDDIGESSDDEKHGYMNDSQDIPNQESENDEQLDNSHWKNKNATRGYQRPKGSMNKGNYDCDSETNSEFAQNLAEEKKIGSQQNFERFLYDLDLFFGFKSIMFSKKKEIW